MRRFALNAGNDMLRLRYFCFLLLILLVACQPGGSFKPESSSPEAFRVRSGQAQTVSFGELDVDPNSYVNQMIRVSGRFIPMPLPDCTRVRGPDTRWALIEEGLRLDARGYEEIVLLLPEGTMLTVDGIWRHYRGPVGCGKEPPVGEVWYLQVTRLLQPNPLSFLNVPEAASGGSPRMTLPPFGGEGTPSVTPSLSQSPTPSPTVGVTTPTMTPTATATGEPSQTPSATATPSASPTESSGESVTRTPTATGTLEPSPTRSGLSTPTPPPPTNTPGAYPVPSPGPTSPPAYP